MDDRSKFAGKPELHNEKDVALARWLHELLVPAPQQERLSAVTSETSQLQPQPITDYHIQFYQQIPDFVMGLLQQESEVTLRHASLLYHLCACNECRSAYIEIYDAMREALYPESDVRPLLGQGTRSLAATPHRMLSHLSQVLIGQAEAELRYGRHAHLEREEAARSLLQMAIRISSHIAQSTVRREALQDLVRVATLFDGPTSPSADDEQIQAYVPVLSAGARRGRVYRRSDGGLRSSQPKEEWAIDLQCQSLSGKIVQHGQTLELHLEELDTNLRGRFVSVSVLLGALLEPIRWRGGNPRAIHSTSTVDADGRLVMPLGDTDMQLSNPEERNLLEAIFMRLEVRPV